MKKLIALGTKDPNPLNWKDWEEVELYIAEDIDQALKMTGYRYYKAVEVDMSKSVHLMSAPKLPRD